METSFDNRMGLLTPNGDFDPVLELRRLRQDLMRRLQLLQQSAQNDEIVVEKEVATISVSKESSKAESTDAPRVQAAEPKSRQRPYSVPSRYETSLYVAPAVQEESLVSREQAATKLDVPAVESQSETIFVDLGWKGSTFCENTAPSFSETVSTSTETVVAAVETDPYEQNEWIAEILGWVNLCIVALGACAAVWGCSRWTGLGLTVCLVGVTLILIGIVGRTLQQRADSLE